MVEIPIIKNRVSQFLDETNFITDFKNGYNSCETKSERIAYLKAMRNHMNIPSQIIIDTHPNWVA